MVEIRGEQGVLPRDKAPAWVSFDPGVTTGVTMWDEKGGAFHINELSIYDLNHFLDYLEELRPRPKGLIVEEYRLYQSKALAQSGSKLDTVQVIGMIKRSGWAMQIPTAEVRADDKEIAASWAGVKWNFKGKTHMPNGLASYLVGYYWLHKNGIIPPRVLEQA